MVISGIMRGAIRASHTNRSVAHIRGSPKYEMIERLTEGHGAMIHNLPSIARIDQGANADMDAEQDRVRE